jgi:uncharacterized protein
MDSEGETTREETLDPHRMDRTSRFRFRCHPGIGCFTRCCGDVNIFLTPYDILRMRKRLGITSGEFLARYTVTVIPESSGFPLVLLRMGDVPEKPCPFVESSGCSIYEDRPWSCRMYPLDPEEDGFRIIGEPESCLGLKEDSEIAVQEYLEGQDVGLYEQMEASLKKLSRDPRLSREKILNPKIQDMICMAMYDLDRFRRFVFESRFLEIFEVDPKMVERIRTDDLELTGLAHRWLEFGLVSGEGMRIRQDMVEGKGTNKGNPPSGTAPSGGGNGL